MTKRDRRFERLYYLLDSSGLEWLSDEVRAFRVAASEGQVNEFDLEALRARHKSLLAVNRPLSVEPEVRSDLLVEIKNFDECLQYLIERVEALAAYLVGGLEFSCLLGIEELNLGSEADSATNHSEVVRHLRQVAHEIREFLAYD